MCPATPSRIAQRIAVTLRRPRSRIAPTSNSTMRWNVGWEKAIPRLITSGSATEGNGNIPAFFLGIVPTKPKKESFCAKSAPRPRSIPPRNGT